MIRHSSRSAFIALVVFIALLIGTVMIAPEEATLGAQMRWVYLHVALTWAGTSLVNLTGLAGLYLIFRPTAVQFSLWVAPAETSGLILFGLGFVLSLVASWTSWGGILWMEPRVLSSVAILAGGTAVVLIIRSLVNPRFVGILAVALSIGLSFVLSSTGRVFHPDNPIGASESSSIRVAFYGLTVISLAVGVVTTMLFRGSGPK